MAWVRPKHPKRVEVDATEALRPLLEYFSCRPGANTNNNNKELIKLPKKKQLLLHDSWHPRPQTHHEEEIEQHQTPVHHHQSVDHHSRAEHHQGIDHHRRVDHHQRVDHHALDDGRASYHERASQRSTSHYTREPSPPPPLPLPSYRSNARPGAHLRLTPSRHRVASDTYIPRRPASRWASAATPLEM